ncbi:MAG: methyltransferase domain-containing protein [Synergistaceae bacterium]|nr:methyltransferase domain-containing protein [Synergistaceae bacterium]
MNDILYGALKMRQPEEGTGPRVNVDTILLADYARFTVRARALEMGCAHGAISLILAKRRLASAKFADFPPIDGIDINPELIGMARENAVLNGLSEHVSFAVADLREHRSLYRAETYDAVIMNPPYDEPGRSRRSANDSVAAAMHGDLCTLRDVVAAAKYLLRNSGKFFLVIRAKRLGELSFILHEHNVKIKRMRAVHPKSDRAASVVLVEAVRASGDGVTVEPPLFICGEDGKYTRSLLDAYRL